MFTCCNDNKAAYLLQNKKTHWQMDLTSLGVWLSAILCPSNRNLSVLAATPCKNTKKPSTTSERYTAAHVTWTDPAATSHFPYLSLAVRLLQLLQMRRHFHLEVNFAAVLLEHMTTIQWWRQIFLGLDLVVKITMEVYLFTCNKSQAADTLMNKAVLWPH